MASNGSTSRKEYLANFIISCRVNNLLDLETVVHKDDALGLFEANEEGRTPLMVACLKGYQDIAKFLLEKGADPNEKDAKKMNTPLHFTCQDTSFLYVFSPTDMSSVHNKSCLSRKKDIVQLLYDHGAEVCHNSHDFLPAHFAALFGMSDLVDFFMNKGCMANEDRLKALELLGVSQSVGFKKCSEAHRSFLAANLLRHELGCHLPKTTPTELEKVFGCRECTTFTELQNIKSDKLAMFIQGILVGERILPEEFKGDCLWVNLFYPHDMYRVEMFLHVCPYGLKLESASRLAIGTVLYGLQHFLNSHNGQYEVTHQDVALHEVISYLEMYTSILMNAERDSILEESYSFTQALGELVAVVILKSYSNDIFERILEAAAGVLKVFEERIFYYRIFQLCRNYYATTNMFDKVVHEHDEYPEDLDAKEKRVRIVRLNHALLILLQQELPKDTDFMREDPMLHSATLLLAEEQDFDVIYSIMHTLIRHSYPPEEKGVHRLTAKDRALRREWYFEKDHPDFEKILTLLSKPTQPLTLQELAARSVIQYRIPYSIDTVPSTVYNFLKGEDFYPA